MSLPSPQTKALDKGRPVAVITGAEHPTGLGSGRAVHQAGGRAWGLTTNTGAAASRSRVWKKLRVVASSAERLDALRELARELDGPAFLLPTQDELVAQVSACRAELGEHYRFRYPDDEIVQTFLDKTRFHDWARPLGLPLPESHVVHSEGDLDAALRNMPFPVIIKPFYRTPTWNAKSPIDKVLRLDRPEDRSAIAFDLFEIAPSFIVSEWIPGPDDAVHYCLAYCDAPGRIAASYTGRKLLQYPRGTGSTAICVGVDNGEVRELAEEVFAQSRYVGLGSLEVKYTPDGRPLITEPTVGRPNLQSYSAVAGGCNLQGMAMADALGLDRGPTCAKPRKAWWVEERAVREVMAARDGEPVPWTLIAREWVSSHASGGAYGAWWDPVPMLALLAETVRRGLRFVFKRAPS